MVQLAQQIVEKAFADRDRRETILRTKFNGDVKALAAAIVRKQQQVGGVHAAIFLEPFHALFWIPLILPIIGVKLCALFVHVLQSLINDRHIPTRVNSWPVRHLPKLINAIASVDGKGWKIAQRTQGVGRHQHAAMGAGWDYPVQTTWGSLITTSTRPRCRVRFAASVPHLPKLWDRHRGAPCFPLHHHEDRKSRRT